MKTMTEQKQGPPRHDPKVITALRRFAISITVFNILGYTVLGFEQPWLWPIIAMVTAYTVEIGLELVASWAEQRAPRFTGNGVRGLVEFLFSAHITALAVNMLTYVNDQVLAMMFGVTVAIGAKWMLRAPVRGRLRHFMNPSNLGIAVILLVYPWASIAPPYHFTENVGSFWDWVIPLVILASGTVLNAMLTKRIWLIAGWLGFFALQAVVRGLVLDTAIPSALTMMTGVAFVLFTNYMVTDPGTTPSKPAPQFAFGAGIAVVYGVLTGAGIAYGLFFATATICLIRGAFLWALHFVDKGRAREDARRRSAEGRDETLDDSMVVRLSGAGSGHTPGQLTVDAIPPRTTG
ncbi:enediyne biosynthesis protein [Amycolatopsis sp. QT-25]|uniref:enediyne biosynthesis protein n=1 Tax=Amycolatopsis sp. QT-25 TaxID=3034022 RepID=UPI0023EAC34D|nr:enediyne biosynthesis protein [Amycolatopsis sp. QT-25]WET83087.1 enediyne biosynthesis protein [Amycolatopsis sp. QT-25]